MAEHSSSESLSTPRTERPMTGPADRPMTREETLAMRGFGWDGDLDQMRSGHVDKTDDAAGQR
ncbi:MAG: hypothetical protein U9R51_03490 [Actinomycetota bacterium]|nr:hypothetical protein [Actinomycetota bacterium]